MLVPTTGSDAREVGQAVSSVLDTMTRAQFTGAQATLDAQRNATGSYEGAPLTPPMTLVRADATSYCVQFAQGAVVRHLTGPGGTAGSGPC